MFNFFKKNKLENNFDYKIEQLKNNNIPHHIAIIMDGNGRWAKKRNLPRVSGHLEGMNVVRETSKTANKLNVGILTLYAFSTENWKRPKTEVDYLMSLPCEFIDKYLDELIAENVRVTMIGDVNQVPQQTLKAVQRGMEATKNNTGLVLNFALNYGSRHEMVHAINNILRLQKEGVITDSITEEDFNQYLMTSAMPDPDLIIRTSGEQRLSNFMLWQAAYSEFWFTDVLWPDFNEEQFLKAIEDYQRRQRRYGGI